MPRVSIIIPVYGKLPYTLACLRSIALHPPSMPFEVIVVDDASPDDSAEVLARIDGLILLRNTSNLGFIGSCNAGASAAHGEILHFLNNDTQVTDGWLDRAIECLDDEPGCGLVGSRLVYPDGRLQEAGGLVFADGSCWNIGRFESRNQPAYLYRRDVDYVTGAAMFMRHALFAQLGGFDLRYAPAYYEDTDLAFAVRKAGHRVVYEPRSLVIHAEGISAGTDLGTGMKQHQRANQAVFADKWQHELAQHPPRGTSLAQAIHRRQRGHILIVGSATPDAARDSGSLRMISMFRILHEEGYRLSFFPDDGQSGSQNTADLGKVGVELLGRPWVPSLPGWLEDNGKGLDAVILSRHGVAGQYLNFVRRSAPQALLVFDTVDLHFLREQRAADLTGLHSMRKQAEASRRSELQIIHSSDISLVVSAHEQQMLKEAAPTARVELLSNIHEVIGRKHPFAGRRDLVFIGGYGHPPNVDAIDWIATDILPAIRALLPDICIHIVGDMPEHVRTALERPGLILHGRVPDLAPWLESCVASIAPLRFGAGVKGKINMAMSYGLPVVATTIAIEGMHLEHLRNVYVANDAEQFAHAVKAMHDDETLWMVLSDASLLNVETHFSPDAARAVLRRILARAP